IRVDLGNDISICKGKSFTFSSNIKNASYLWSTGDTVSSIDAKQTGSYWLKVDSARCVASDTVNLKIVELPVVNIGSDTAICSGTSLKIQSNIPNASYLWSTGDTTSGISINKS